MRMHRKFIYFLITIATLFSFQTLAQSVLKDSLDKVVQFNKLDSPTVKAALALGKIFRNEQDSAKSADYYFKALDLAKKSNFNRGITLSYVELGYLFELTQDMPKAETYYIKALQSAKKYQHFKELALAYSYMFFIYSAKSEFNNAVIYADSALNIYIRLNRKIDIANQYNNIGLMLFKQNKNKEAILNYQKALSIYEELGKTAESNKIGALNNIGLIFEALKNYDTAIKYFNSVRKTAIANGYAKQLNEVNNNLGSSYFYLKQYKKSYQYYYENLASSKASKDPVKYGIALSNLGNVTTELKLYKRAEEYFKQAILEFQKVNNFQGIGEAYVTYAKLLGLDERLSEANDLLQKALVISVKYNLPVLKQNVYESLAEINKLQKNYNQAYLMQDSAFKLKDENFNIETNKQIADLEIKYETSEKEKQIALNKTAIALGNMQLQKKNNWLLLSSFSILFLIVGTGLVVRNGKLKQKKLKSEAAYQLKLATAETTNQIQEEKLRISRELHDNIGSQLTFISNSIESFEAENGAAIKLNEAQTITKNTIRELRRTVWLINQPEFSLEEFVIKLRDYVRPYETGKPIINIISDEAPDCILKPITATNLFRIIQEGVNNSLKYADASLLEVTLNHQSNKLNVQISDNGKGFDLDKNSEGYGLKNIKARVETLKGECFYSSKLTEGTQINLILPL